jgi:hypothetical protein
VAARYSYDRRLVVLATGTKPVRYDTGRDTPDSWYDQGTKLSVRSPTRNLRPPKGALWGERAQAPFGGNTSLQPAALLEFHSVVCIVAADP